MIESQFLFAACQAGAEGALKREAEARAPQLRPSFSRPGFVTFKAPEPLALETRNVPRLVFARTRGLSLGRAEGDDRLAELAQRVWALESVGELVARHAPLGLHVWQRDTAAPGEGGFEPGGNALSALVRKGLAGAAPPDALGRGGGPAPSAVILDVAIVAPNQWWVGAHAARARTDRWPGGVPALRLPEHAVSRAYLKMGEALRWSAFPSERGDVWAELGCAPGGASQALLERGMGVIGVDPADVDPAVTEHPDFLHVRARAMDARRKEFSPATWLAADINAAPEYTLDAVEPIVTHAGVRIRGLLLTLKLPDWSLAAPAALNAYAARVRGWGYRDVRMRQLAFNRRELCLAALRSRGQRRVRR